MTTLYELTDRLQELLQWAETDEVVEGIPESDLEIWMEEVEREIGQAGKAIEDKLELCGQVVRQLEADEAALKAEKDRFGAREKATKNHRERLKNYMVQAIRINVLTDTKGRLRVKTATMLTWVQKNPPSVDADNCDLFELPEQFVEFVPKVKSSELMAHIKESGGELPKGAALKEEKWHLRMK